MRDDRPLFDIRLCWVALLCFFASTPSASFAQSLMDLYLVAKANDTQYNAARHQLEANLEKGEQGRAGLLPTVHAVGGKNHQMGEASFSDALPVHRDVHNWNWSMQVTQPVFRLGNVAAYAQGRAQVRQAQSQFVLAQQELILRVAQTYFDWQVARESAQVAQAQVEAIGQQLEMAKRMFEVGTGTITDVHEAKARHALVKAQHVTARNDMMNKESEIERLTGQSFALSPVRMTKSLPPLQTELQDWLHTGARANPQIQIQQATLDIAREEVNKSMAAHAPTLDLVASKGANYASGSLSSPADMSTRVNSFQRGVQLNIPLFAAGATQSKVRESLALEAKAREDLLGAQRQAGSLIRQAHAGVINGQAQVEALELAVEAGASAVESNKIGFTIGTRINPDVLNAEQQLYAAMRDLSKARADAVMQALKLKAAVGALEADDLQMLEPTFEPSYPKVVTSTFQPNKRSNHGATQSNRIASTAQTTSR